MNNKLITLAFLAFVIYVYFTDEKNEVKSSDNIDMSSVVDLVKEPDIDKKYPVNSQPSAKSKELDEQYPVFQDKTTDADKKQTGLNLIFKSPNELGFFEKRIYNIATNLLHTPNGQKMLDKLMHFQPNKNDFFKDPYLNITKQLLVSNDHQLKAQCGDQVEFHALYKSDDDKHIYNSKSNNRSEFITIGEGKFIRGIENNLIGLSEGEIARFVLPHSMSNSTIKPHKYLIDFHQFIAADIELISISTSNFAFKEQVQVFEKEINNSQVRYLCGEYIPMDFKIKTLEGKIIFNSSQESTFEKIKIGSHEVPFAINKIAEGAFKDSTRTALVPAESILKNTNNDAINYLPSEIIEQIRTNDFYLLEASIK